MTFDHKTAASAKGVVIFNPIRVGGVMAANCCEGRVAQRRFISVAMLANLAAISVYA